MEVTKTTAQGVPIGGELHMDNKSMPIIVMTAMMEKMVIKQWIGQRIGLMSQNVLVHAIT